MHRWRDGRLNLRLAVFLAVGLVVVGFYAFASFASAYEIKIYLVSGLDRTALAELVGESLGWSKSGKQEFAKTLAQIQWDAFKSELADIFTHRFSWGSEEREIFLTQSAKYAGPDLDFLGTVYAPGTYMLARKLSAAEISNIFIMRLKELGGSNMSAFLKNLLMAENMEKISKFVASEMDLLPDLLLYPAKDINIEKKDGSTYLLFTTMYYNNGEGPLELRPDPKTKGIKRDIDRDVLQRIYRIDGTWREKFVGNFLWHQPHLHYHYRDFVEYDLEAIDAPNAPDLSGVRTKSPFCVRDVSRVDIRLEQEGEEALYLICGKELQGISVGWADTYFYTYSDQRLNISDLPSGTYRLTFTVNPENALDEINLNNNQSSVEMYYNRGNGTVKVLKESPESMPEFKHVYYEQVFE